MSAIEWTGRTWNPTTGCDQVSPGCDNCYALTMAKRLKAMGQAKYQNDGDPRTSGPGFGFATHPDALDEPLRRQKPTLWFVNSMSDLFHKDAGSAFVASVFDVMRQTPQHTYQILTKRPKNMRRMLRTAVPGDGWPFPNVWLGTSVESADYLWRVDALRDTPAVIRFLSLEPLLGPLPELDLTGIDWVIVGGESGKGARALREHWVLDIVDQCHGAGVAVFVKQLGSVWAREDAPTYKFDAAGERVVQASAKGGDPDLWPERLRVREFPAGVS